MRGATAALFSETYRPHGIADELDARYGFCELYLRELQAGAQA
jgi:hypothetical protein